MATEILVDDAFDVDAFVLEDMPFAAYYPLVVGPEPPIIVLPQPGGGIGLPHPRKLPFWSAPGVRAAVRVRGPAGGVEAGLRAEEDEMLSDENRLLGLL